MRVLIAGSEGSLMQQVIPYLLVEGHEVRGADNLGRYGAVSRRRNYEFCEGDLCDRGFVAKACWGMDAVIQAAAQIYGVRGFHSRSADILSKDMQLHINMLQAVSALSVERFAYISSSMVYERSKEHPSREDTVRDARVPLTDYGLSKLVGERLCQAFGRDYGLRYTVWRPFNIITPYETAEDEPGISHVFADFIDKLLVRRQNPMDILGDGEQVRCFTWIEDVASAIAEFSFAPVTLGQAINLGNPEPVTMKELAALIFRKGQERGIIDPGATLSFNFQSIYDDDVRRRIPDIAVASRLLGWRPSVALDEALDRCIDHLMRSA